MRPASYPWEKAKVGERFVIYAKDRKVAGEVVSRAGRRYGRRFRVVGQRQFGTRRGKSPLGYMLYMWVVERERSR